MDIEHILECLVIAYRASFIIGVCSLAAAKYCLPEFLQYGKTLVGRANTRQWKMPLLAKLIHLTVPKSFFSHFYYLSSSLSILATINYPRAPIVWLILIHSLRRLYETKYICTYTAHSRMNWSHYVVGIWFYSSLHMLLNISLLENEIPASFGFISTIIFILASMDQCKNHQTLSSLIKYSLPTDGMFKIVCCPHYLDEILIYGSFTRYNRAFWWPLAWVTLSLSISALENKKYYVAKFKETGQVPKWAIVPLVL